MQSPPIWRWPLSPASPQSSPPKPSLYHAVSMLNLHSGSTWQWPNSPTSPRSPPLTSRCATPVLASRNPWSKSPSPPLSPLAAIDEGLKKTPTQSPSTSRTATPIAPQPIHPPCPIPRTPFQQIPPSPAPSCFQLSPTPTPYAQRQQEIASPVSLAEGILTPALIAELKLSFPSLLSRQGWDRPTAQICYIWALRNPRTALLLYMTENLAAWPVAAIFAPLEDGMLPFSKADLSEVVNDPQEVVNVQWRVMVRLLPVDGEHIDLNKTDALPLQPVKDLKPESVSGEPGMDRVHWLGGPEDRIYARKTIVFTRQAQRTAIASQLRSLKALRHENIVRIRCSYTQTNAYGIITTPVAECDLGEYLQLPLKTIRPELIRGWLADLAGALEHIHSHDIRHQNICPRKIMINGDHIFFGAFGLEPPPLGTESPNPSPSSMDQTKSFTYAAPESVHRQRRSRPADIFSLGAVFLEMMTVIKGQSIETFRSFRQRDGNDSFHANLDKVGLWSQRLESIPRQTRHRRALAIDSMALSFITPMLNLDAAKRPRARLLSSSFAGWNAWRTAPVSGSNHSIEGVFQRTTYNDARRQDFESLDGYYARN
ncbi:kinase-like protein [Xylona heveae TC161]|uniref:Kinase-like protein n=1 Tax=Xylona heveae (strain CBS 132557 / TC161) TaxID=1328760 RepID=A0A165HD13_XYLHT|nr:kinase-like protein [Xylona heveae TC161]KZF23324.1 kinase-like protein [Xylona heveae TC161]